MTRAKRQRRLSLLYLQDTTCNCPPKVEYRHRRLARVAYVPTTYDRHRRLRKEWDTSVLDKKADYVGLCFACRQSKRTKQAKQQSVVHCNINLSSGSFLTEVDHEVLFCSTRPVLGISLGLYVSFESSRRVVPGCSPSLFVDAMLLHVDVGVSDYLEGFDFKTLLRKILISCSSLLLFPFISNSQSFSDTSSPQCGGCLCSPFHFCDVSRHVHDGRQRSNRSCGT
jgi:hypothetical protein